LGPGNGSWRYWRMARAMMFVKHPSFIDDLVGLWIRHVDFYLTYHGTQHRLLRERKLPVIEILPPPIVVVNHTHDTETKKGEKGKPAGPTGRQLDLSLI
jgi:hypothetical protein